MFTFSFLLHNGLLIVYNNELSNPILSSSIYDINSRFAFLALPCLALRFCDFILSLPFTERLAVYFEQRVVNLRAVIVISNGHCISPDSYVALCIVCSVWCCMLNVTSESKQ